MPSRSTLEALRLPAAIVLLAIAGFVLLAEPGGGAPNPGPTPLSVVATDTGGAVLPGSTETPAANPEPTVAPTPEATPTPTPDTFTARVHACRSISGDRCNRELNRLDRLERVTALVRFDDARAGDTIAVMLAGDGGTVASDPYALEGGGKGHYYAILFVRDLPPGEYTLTATRNGEEVARTELSKRR